MMDRDELTRRMIENDADTLRAERNAAQQRAEQAERERDEARAVIDRAVEILLTPYGPDEETWRDQIANEHAVVFNLLSNFRARHLVAAKSPSRVPAQPVPTVKADDDRYPILNRMTITPKDDTPTVKADAPQAQPAWTPMTGAEIAASLEGKPPILPADFDIDRAPTVKADDGELTELLDKARDIWDAAGDVEMVFYKRTNYLHAAVSDILDILERLVKWGAK